MKKFAIFGLLFVAVSVYAFAMHWRDYVPAEQGVPAQSALRFESAEFGLSFLYPQTHQVKLHTEGTAEREWNVLTILPKGYVPPVAGEGPPVISVAKYPNPEGLSLEAWVKGDARSNWKLAAEDGGLGSMTVGGKQALAYRYSGLYETDAVAVAHNGNIYLFSVGWMTPEDTLRGDFDTLLQSVMFR